MNQLRLWSRARVVTIQSGCFSRSSTHTFVTGNGCRFLSRGGNSLPQRRTTSSSDDPLATSKSDRTSTSRWLLSTEDRPHP